MRKWIFATLGALVAILVVRGVVATSTSGPMDLTPLSEAECRLGPTDVKQVMRCNPAWLPDGHPYAVRAAR